MLRKTPLLFLILTALLVIVPACKQEAKPPAPLPLAQMPAELSKAFSQAAPGLKDIIGKINGALGQGDLPGAYEGVKILCSLREATDEQRMISTRAMLTLTTELQAAAGKGDKLAEAALQSHRSSK